MMPTSEQWYMMSDQEQLAWSRRATTQERLHLSGVLTWAAQQQVWRELREAHPEANEIELKVLFVRRQYGDELADRIQPELERRAQSAKEKA